MSEDTGTPIRKEYPLIWKMGEGPEAGTGWIVGDAHHAEARKALTEIWQARLQIDTLTAERDEAVNRLGLRRAWYQEKAAALSAAEARVATLEEESASYMNQSDTWQERSRAAEARNAELEAERDEANDRATSTFEHALGIDARRLAAEARIASLEAERDRLLEETNYKWMNLHVREAEARNAELTKALGHIRGAIGLTIYEGTPVSVHSGKQIISLIDKALADGAEQ